jgi:hypothetical protein
MSLIIPLTSKDRAPFVALINAALDSLSVQNQEDARIAAAALRALLEGRDQPQGVPPSLQERISCIRDLVNDPLSVGDPACYPEGQLREYQHIAMERIPAKIRELLSFSPSDIEREARRRQDQRRAAERDQEYLRTRQPPTGDACTISEEECLRQQQAAFAREALPTPSGIFVVHMHAGLPEPRHSRMVLRHAPVEVGPHPRPVVVAIRTGVSWQILPHPY